MQTFFFSQNALIVWWQRDQRSTGLCHFTPLRRCYPEWLLPTAPARHPAPRPKFNHPAHPSVIHSMPIFSLSCPATSLPWLLTPATHLPCTHPVVSQPPLGAWAHLWLVRCHLLTTCRVSTLLARGACRTSWWRETPVMTSIRSTPVWRTYSCRVMTLNVRQYDW